MTYEIRTYEGVGPISFGMSAPEVREAVGAPHIPIDKGGGPVPTDVFTSLGILVYYKPPAVCEAVEFAGPESPTFRGQQLLRRPYSEVEEWLKTLDAELETDTAGLTSYKLGLGLYAPSALKEPDEPVEGVFVFEQGYYERHAGE